MRQEEMTRVPCVGWGNTRPSLDCNSARIAVRAHSVRRRRNRRARNVPPAGSWMGQEPLCALTVLWGPTSLSRVK